jgi:hypothetical protein
VGSNCPVLTFAGREVPGVLQHVIFLICLCSLQENFLSVVFIWC